MLLLIFFAAVLVVGRLWRRPSPTLLLAAIYMTSLACGVTIGYDYEFSSFQQYFNLGFQALVLGLLILPWRRFVYRTTIQDPEPTRLRRLTAALVCVNALALAVFATASYLVLTGVVDFEVYKNHPGAAEEIVLPFSHNVRLVAIFSHSTAYFLMPLGFYYLTKKRHVIGALCLLGSTNIAFFGLQVASRSGVVEYVFLCGMYFPFFWWRMDRSTRIGVGAVALLAMIVTAGVFAKVSVNRFDQFDFSGVHTSVNSLVSDSTTQSYLVYVSQWFRNGNRTMSLYAFETLGGELSTPLVALVGNKLGIMHDPPETLDAKLYSLWEENFNTFNGLTPHLLFDFGYLGTLVFVAGYGALLRVLSPRRGVMSFNGFVVIGVLFSLPAMGIFNSQLKSPMYNLVLLYAVAVYVYLGRRRRKQVPAAGTIHAGGVLDTT